MKNIKYLFASGAVALLFAVAPLLASANEGSVHVNASVKGDTNPGLHLGSWLHFGTDTGKSDMNKNHEAKDGDNDRDDRDGDKHHSTTTPEGKTVVAGTVTSVSGSTITLQTKNGAVYSVNASGAVVFTSKDTAVTVADVRAGDTIVVRGTATGQTIMAEKIVDGALVSRVFLSALGVAGGGVITAVNGSTFTVKPFGTAATTTVTMDASTAYKINGQATTSSALSVGSHVLLTGTSTSNVSIAASIVNIFSAGFGFLKHLFVR